MEPQYTEAPKNDAEENKPDYSLLPMDLLEHLIPAYEEGLVKYYRDSWRMGFRTTRMLASALRHLTRYCFFGEDYDPDSLKFGIKKHHLSAVLFCIICMIDTFYNHPELDDRFCKKGLSNENCRTII